MNEKDRRRFDKEFSREGGYYYPADDELLQRLLHTAQEVLNRTSDKRVVVGIVKHPDVNAGIAYRDGTYFVGLWTGLHEALMELAYSYFNHLPKLPWFRGRSLSENEQVDVIIQVLHSAVGFVIRHEWAHMQLGHVGKLKAAGGLRCDEDPINTKHHLDPSLRQAFEIQADMFAALNLVPNEQHLLRYVTLGIVTVLSLFDKRCGSISEYKRSSHPHPLVRLLAVWRAFEQAERGQRTISLLEGIEQFKHFAQHSAQLTWLSHTTKETIDDGLQRLDTLILISQGQIDSGVLDQGV